MKKNPKKILIMGLPGAGKTTLAEKLAPLINGQSINGDEVRRKANDWDFSMEGRLRQSKRIRDLAQDLLAKGKYVIADFVCPTPETRQDFKADYVIWIDTVKEGRFNDTNKMFIKPKNFFFRVTSKNANFWAGEISKKIIDDQKKFEEIL